MMTYPCTLFLLTYLASGTQPKGHRTISVTIPNAQNTVRGHRALAVVFQTPEPGHRALLVVFIKAFGLYLIK